MPKTFDPEHPAFDISQPIFLAVRDYLRQLTDYVQENKSKAEEYVSTMSKAFCYTAFLSKCFDSQFAQVFSADGESAMLTVHYKQPDAIMVLVAECYASNPVMPYCELPSNSMFAPIGKLVKKKIDTSRMHLFGVEAYVDLEPIPDNAFTNIPFQMLPAIMREQQLQEVHEKLDQIEGIQGYLQGLSHKQCETIGPCFANLFAPTEGSSLKVTDLMDPDWQTGLETALAQVHLAASQARASAVEIV